MTSRIGYLALAATALAVHVMATLEARSVRLIEDERSRPRSYKATRRLAATNARFKMSGWVEALTEFDGQGFRYRVLDAGGSEYIQRKVLLPVLAREQQAVEAGEMRGAALESGNYTFGMAEEADEGLLRISLTPLRKDSLLVEGAMLLTNDGDLVRVEGRLVKNPSFWTRRVDVVRRYSRVNGVRVPVETTSTARVLIAGTSSFSMCYAYEAINDEPVASRTSCE